MNLIIFIAIFPVLYCGLPPTGKLAGFKLPRTSLSLCVSCIVLTFRIHFPRVFRPQWIFMFVLRFRPGYVTQGAELFRFRH